MNCLVNVQITKFSKRAVTPGAAKGLLSCIGYLIFLQVTRIRKFLSYWGQEKGFILFKLRTEIMLYRRPKKNMFWDLLKFCLTHLRPKYILGTKRVRSKWGVCTVCAVCSVQCAVCSVQYSVTSLKYALCSVQCALCSVQCAVFVQFVQWCVCTVLSFCQSDVTSDLRKEKVASMMVQFVCFLFVNKLLFLFVQLCSCQFFPVWRHVWPRNREGRKNDGAVLEGGKYRHTLAKVRPNCTSVQSKCTQTKLGSPVGGNAIEPCH